jgi:hypothetical protein
LVHQLDHPPEANPVAVVPPAIVQRIRIELLGAGNNGGTGHVMREVLDVDIRQHRHPRTLRELELGPVDDRHVVIVRALGELAAVDFFGFRCHGFVSLLYVSCCWSGFSRDSILKLIAI